MRARKALHRYQTQLVQPPNLKWQDKNILQDALVHEVGDEFSINMGGLQAFLH